MHLSWHDPHTQYMCIQTNLTHIHTYTHAHTYTVPHAHRLTRYTNTPTQTRNIACAPVRLGCFTQYDLCEIYLCRCAWEYLVLSHCFMFHRVNILHLFIHFSTIRTLFCCDGATMVNPTHGFGGWMLSLPKNRISGKWSIHLFHFYRCCQPVLYSACGNFCSCRFNVSLWRWHILTSTEYCQSFLL